MSSISSVNMSANLADGQQSILGKTSLEKKRKGPPPKYNSEVERDNALKRAQGKYRAKQKKFGLMFYQRAVTPSEAKVLDLALSKWREENPLAPEMSDRKSRPKSE